MLVERILSKLLRSCCTTASLKREEVRELSRSFSKVGADQAVIFDRPRHIDYPQLLNDTAVREPSNNSDEPFQVCFEVQTKCVLCWVDEEGKLYHHYELQVGTKHEESTYLGHTFVLYLHPAKYNGKIAENISDIPSRLILAVFRSMSNPGIGKCFRVKVKKESSEAVVDRLPDCEYRVFARCAYDQACENFPLTRAGEPQSNELAKREEYLKLFLELPEPTVAWELIYELVCPSVPRLGSTLLETVYLWGDISFGAYDNEARFAIHRNYMNQIVPQLMIGHCLYTSDPDNDYKPEWKTFETWVAQSQYYWQDERGEHSGSHALCGEIVHVKPTDILRTSIRFDPIEGSIIAKIGVVDENGYLPGKVSEIVIPRPFLHQGLEISKNSSWPGTSEDTLTANGNFTNGNTPVPESLLPRNICFPPSRVDDLSSVSSSLDKLDKNLNTLPKGTTNSSVRTDATLRNNFQIASQPEKPHAISEKVKDSSFITQLEITDKSSITASGINDPPSITSSRIKCHSSFITSKEANELSTATNSKTRSNTFESLHLKDESNNRLYYTTWKQFFEDAASASLTKGPIARPDITVEYKGRVSTDGLNSLSPVTVRQAAMNKKCIFPNKVAVRNFRPEPLSCEAQTHLDSALSAGLPDPPMLFVPNLP